MNPNSIRWRLPLSYAAIALLAAFSLGSVMLLVLNSFYTRQERAYLVGNAQALQPMVVQILQSNLPEQVLEDQLTVQSFFSQTQIRVLDASNNPIANSGIPNSTQMLTLSGGAEGTGNQILVFDKSLTTQSSVIDSIQPSGGTTITNPTAQVMPVEGPFIIGANTFVPISVSPYGYQLGGNATVVGTGRRSAQVVSLPLAAANGSTLGTLELSHGPAYGADILHSVTLAWLAASVLAVGLAALVGWFVSRQVTQPVLALTKATHRMEQGDLLARAELPGQQTMQEFQALAHSFNAMAQHVEDTVSTLRGFVSDAAHEMNTPLTALKTNLELAAVEADAVQKATFLSRALEQNHRLEQLTSGLLDLSRIEAAPSAPNFEPLDLRQLSAEIGERFASRAEQAGRAFNLTLPDGEISLRGNALQLQRAVDNLLENALKFTPAGGSITLNLERRQGEAVLDVTDTGIGIPSEDLPHLFERFHRGRNAANYPGSGLGLAIVKAIIDAHGGRVEAQSSAKGSTFSIIMTIE